MKVRWQSVGMFIVLSVITGAIAIFALSGCPDQSSLQIYLHPKDVKSLLKDPCDVMVILKGKPADTVAVQLADNMKTKQATVQQIYKYNGFLYALFVVLFVGGLIFWRLTGSRFGWIIPTASILGIGLIIAFTAYALIFSAVCVLLAIGLLTWKAIEYHKERDNAIKVQQ